MVIFRLPSLSLTSQAQPEPNCPAPAAAKSSLHFWTDPKAWFTYYYWDDDAVAPDFARTIDIHRKPGYDPAELFIDPAIRWPAAKVAAFLARKKFGFRGLLEVIPLGATLVRGSHGRDEVPDDEQPVVIGAGAESVQSAEGVFGYLRGRLV